MDIIENTFVKNLFQQYPSSVCQKLNNLRDLVFEVASEIEDKAALEETIKWGEASYVTKHGSTLRMDWKKNNPSQYAMYFHCKTKLVDTFKELYYDKFIFEGNRAIVFDLKDQLPVNELKHCIRLSLTYHKVKNLPLLGA